MVEKLKLKHLDTIIGDKKEHASIMSEVLGYKKTRWKQAFNFIKSMDECLQLVEEAKQLKPKQIQWDESCPIRKPNHIDNITYRAMLELEKFLGAGGHESISESIAEAITKVCYSANINGDYDSNTESYKRFKERVMNTSFVYMMGLYNWIDKSLNDSQQFWNQLFYDVEVEDEDYKQAGGDRMKQFNVINTIKSVCKEFNVTYDRAWQMEYALIQTSSLSSATSNYIQDQMRQIKERKMKEQQRQQGLT